VRNAVAIVSARGLGTSRLSDESDVGTRSIKTTEMNGEAGSGPERAPMQELHLQRRRQGVNMVGGLTRGSRRNLREIRHHCPNPIASQNL
jgi:hypothetical protein